MLLYVYMYMMIGHDTPSPQVGSPKVDSDGNSPQQPVATVAQEGEGEGAKGGGREDDDPCTRSEGVVCFIVSDPTSMESRLSDPVIIRNVPW